MGTHRFPILGAMTIPDTSGEVFFQPYSLIDSGATVDPLVLTFNNSGTKDGVRGSFRVPENYVGTALLKVVCTANATGGTIVFDYSALPRSGSEDMGGTPDTEVTGNVTKGGTAFTREEVSITLTDANYAAGDEVLFELFRDTITDTMAAACAVFGVYFEYSDV